MRRVLCAAAILVWGCSNAPTDASPAPPAPHRPTTSSIVTPDALTATTVTKRAVANPTADVDHAGILAEGARDSGEVALTFDDGPSAENTPEVLRILAAHHVHAAFFLSADRLAGEGVVADVHRKLARAIAGGGHVVGNHALDHLPLDTCTNDVVWCVDQIDGAARLLASATGSDPHWFRPPYGRMVPEAQRLLAARGDELVLWSIDAQDVDDDDPEHIAHRLEQQLLFAGQGVVLLHDLRAPSVRALSLLLDWLDLHPKFHVVDLPTYFDHAAAAPYPFANRLQLLHEREREHGNGA